MHNSLLHTILNKNNTGLPATAFLQNVVNDYPYFSPAHFFLLQQLQQEDEQYATVAAKTALLFNNPYWLQYKLQQTTDDVNGKQAPVIALYGNSKIEEKEKSEEAESISKEEITGEPSVIFENNTDNDDDNAEIVNTGNDAVTVSAKEEQEETAAITHEQTEAVLPENTDNDDDNAELVNTGNRAVEFKNEEVDTAIVISSHAKDALPENTDNDDDNAVMVQDEPQNAAMPEIKIDLAASLKSAANETAPAFEPMHLVDYFASQGIKLSEEVQSADKLGRQLKSFTDWLKTMKKIHVPEQGAGLTGAEIAVQAMAEKSNAENEIVTEAMAEVFAQQGKASKAVEVYQKLSLLNPGKSAYFAAQIEKLKG